MFRVCDRDHKWQAVRTGALNASGCACAMRRRWDGPAIPRRPDQVTMGQTMAPAADGYWRDRSAARSVNGATMPRKGHLRCSPGNRNFRKFRYVQVGLERDLTTIEHRAGVEVKVPGGGASGPGSGRPDQVGGGAVVSTRARRRAPSGCSDRIVVSPQSDEAVANIRFTLILGGRASARPSRRMARSSRRVEDRMSDDTDEVYAIR